MVTQQAARTDFNGLGWKFSPVLWGSALSAVFYSLLPLAVRPGSALQELFCGHPLAYTATCLFWMGIAGLVVKLLRLPVQKRALKESFRPPDSSTAGESALQIEARIAALPASRSQTWSVSRLADLCTFVRSRNTTRGLNGHLEYLAEFCGEQLNHSYAFVRTVTWAVPIIGFLGTVVGITQAIQHLDPQQLTTSFDLVAKGLSVAFGTTALALGLSLILVFGAYLVEKQERTVLADIEMLAVEWLTGLFPAEPETGHSLADAEAQAARQLLEQTELMISRQTESWESAVTQLRTRWVETFDRHQTELDQSLRSGLQATLEGHGRQLAESRQVLIDGVRGAGNQIEHSLKLAQEQQRSQLQIFNDSFQQLTGGWQNQLEAQEQLAVAWSRLADGQEQLTAVERKLAENLQIAQAAESLNETLHSLNAAVHLLTARVRPAA